MANPFQKGLNAFVTIICDRRFDPQLFANDLITRHESSKLIRKELVQFAIYIINGYVSLYDEGIQPESQDELNTLKLARKMRDAFFS